MFEYPIYTLMNDYQHDPYLVRMLDGTSYFVLFTDRILAIRLGVAFKLKWPPQGALQIDNDVGLLAWLKAAKGQGASEVWIDVEIEINGRQVTFPEEFEYVPIDEMIEETSQRVAESVEGN